MHLNTEIIIIKTNVFNSEILIYFFGIGREQVNKID